MVGKTLKILDIQRNLGESFLHTLPTLHIPSLYIRRSFVNSNTTAAIIDTSTAPVIIGIVVISCHLHTGSGDPQSDTSSTRATLSSRSSTLHLALIMKSQAFLTAIVASVWVVAPASAQTYTNCNPLTSGKSFERCFQDHLLKT